MLKFSIIIPIYNAELYIENCLNSIILQNYSNLEVLLIDDGSTDDSSTLCDNFAKNDSRIKVFHVKNKGVSSARNIGLLNATGDYIIFVDADDYLDNGVFNFANKILSEKKVDLLKYNYSIIYGNFKKKYKFSIPTNVVIEKKDYMQELYGYLFNTNDFGNIWNCFFKKNLLNKKLFDEKLKYAEDRKFMFQNLIDSNSIFVSDYKFYNYVINKSSAMNKKDYKKAFVQLINVIEVNNYIYNLLGKCDYKEKLKESIVGDFDNFIISNICLKSYDVYCSYLKKVIHEKELKKVLKNFFVLFDESFENFYLNIDRYKLLKRKKFVYEIKKYLKNIIIKK